MDRFTKDFLIQMQADISRQLSAISAFLDGANSVTSTPPPAAVPAFIPPAGRLYKDCGNGWGIVSYIGAIAKSEGGDDDLALQYTDGTFREHRNGLIQYRYYGSDGKQHSIYGRSRSECWKKRNKLEHGVTSSNDNISACGSSPTYKEWLAEWMRLYKEPSGLKTGYLKAIRSYIKNYIVPILGTYLLSEIKTLTLQKFLVGIESDCTRTKCAAVLSESLRDAVAAELISRNPYEGVKFKRYEPPELGAMTHREQLLFLEAVDKSRLADWKMPTFARALLMTGMRQGELNGLRACDIDFDNMEISVNATWDRYDKDRVKPKSRAGKRVVPIAPALAELLQPLVEAVKTPSELLFGYEGSYTPRYFGKIFRSMGISFTGHITRHTFITNAYELGFPPYIVKRLVGHARIEHADVYLAMRKPKDFIETPIVGYMRELKRMVVLDPDAPRT